MEFRVKNSFMHFWLPDPAVTGRRSKSAPAVLEATALFTVAAGGCAYRVDDYIRCQRLVSNVLARSCKQSVLTRNQFARQARKSIEVADVEVRLDTDAGQPSSKSTARSCDEPSEASTCPPPIGQAAVEPAAKLRLQVKNTFLHVGEHSEPDSASRVRRRSSSASELTEGMHRSDVDSDDGTGQRGGNDCIDVTPTLAMDGFDDGACTAMIKNVPYNCSRSYVLEVVHAVGFRGRYDFFYLPTRRCSKSNVGYAFIGFPVPADAKEFAKVMTGYRFENSGKVAMVVPAHIQGTKDNAAHFKGTRVMSSTTSPIFKAVAKPGRRSVRQLPRNSLNSPV